MGLLGDLLKGAKAAGKEFVKEAQLREKAASTQKGLAAGLRKAAEKIDIKPQLNS